MNPEFRLWFLKLLVNWPVRLLDRFLKFPAQVEYPQSRMLLSTYGQMLKAYHLDCSQGVFGNKPDGNFERFLRVSAKVLVNISESDRYYRSWLGLAYVLATEEYFNRLEKATPPDLIFEIKRQWLSDLNFLPEKVVESDLEGFYEYSLCNYLGNLAHKQVTKNEIGGIKN